MRDFEAQSDCHTHAFLQNMFAVSVHMSGSPRTPLAFLKDLIEMDERYAILLQELVSIYPGYAASSGAGGEADLFAEHVANIQQVQADLFLFRDQLEAATADVALETVKRDQQIKMLEDKDKALSRNLEDLDMQLGSSEGRLHDAVFLYRESYLANVLLGCVVLGAAVGTYKSMQGGNAQ